MQDAGGEAASVLKLDSIDSQPQIPQAARLLTLPSGRAIRCKRSIPTAPRLSASIAMPQTDRLGKVRAVGMFQRKIVDPKRGAELLVRQVRVDPAKAESEVVRIRWKHRLVAERNRLGCGQVDLIANPKHPSTLNSAPHNPLSIPSCRKASVTSLFDHLRFTDRVQGGCSDELRPTFVQPFVSLFCDTPHRDSTRCIDLHGLQWQGAATPTCTRNAPRGRTPGRRNILNPVDQGCRRGPRSCCPSPWRRGCA